MISYAFKYASGQGLYSYLISKRTKSPFSHVEVWLSGPQDKAICFSSRPGEGCGFKLIDLSDAKVWKIVNLPPVNEELWVGFCHGSNGKGYDYLGILGYDTGHGEHKERDRFCSEWGTEVGQVCSGWWKGVKRWLVSPGDLYTLVTEL